MSDSEQIVPLRLHQSGSAAGNAPARQTGPLPERDISFDRGELSIILNLYGHKVAEGEWRDYAIDFGRDRAVFSVFRRTSEQPLYRIVKQPRLARRQGIYAVIAQGGMILRRGHDLAQVVRVLLRPPRPVVV